MCEAKSVKFTDFVAPGQSLRIQVQQTKRENDKAYFKFHGDVAGRGCVGGRLVLQCANLADDYPELAELDDRMKAHQRGQETLLIRGAELAATPA